MTENKMGSGRPRKNTRKNNSSNNSFQHGTNGITDMTGAQVIVEPLSNYAGAIPENEESSDMAYSPTQLEDGSEICALCNCGQEMVFILGQITQYLVAPGTLKKLEKIKNESTKNGSEVSSSDSAQKEPKDKSLYKNRRKILANDIDTSLSPDMTTFGTASIQDFTDILDENGFLFAHHCCAAWSAGVSENDSHDLENVDKAVAKALTKKCSHCQRYGASVECQVHRCNKIYHYPCCASAGTFQDITSMILLCPDHLDRTERLADADPSCYACSKTEEINVQLFCTSCGRHFHNYCVDMTIPITPAVRMGWQCSYCKVCLGCKQPGDEDRMLCCDQCDKGYHTYCLDPPIANVPTSVWKCVSCRKCDDCGSTRAGRGSSSKWHNSFTLCDGCYQHRKKGQSCSICSRGFKLNNTDILNCCRCLKFLHKECDPSGMEDNYICSGCFKVEDHGFVEEANEESIMIDEDTTLSVNEETNGSYDYDLLESGQKKLSIEEAELFSMAASQEFIDSCNLNNNNLTDLNNEDVGSSSRLSSEDCDDSKQDEKFSESTVDSPYGSVVSESTLEQAHSNFFPATRQFTGRNRRTKKPGRGRGKLQSGSFDSKWPPICIDIDAESVSQNSIELPDSTSNITPLKASSQPESVNTDDADDDDFAEDEGEDGLHSTVLIVSTRDSFTLKQDVCMCCGSFGKGREGYLIGCIQCGHCFHPYCVNVKVNEVILSRGWRCIDCTVCEGCGKNADEANLLLCDLCDVSFHTYCLDPPLEEVPVGGWKCQWCVVCEDCGVKDAGFGCSWMANYSQCGQCSSEQYCSICSDPYEANNLVIQCEKCNRWAHAECDGLNSEEDSKLACSMTYHCAHCRPKTRHLGIYSNLKSSVITKVSIKKALNNTSQQPDVASNKKTKTLHNLKSQKLSKAALREQRRAKEDSMPLVPINSVTDESGVVDMDLNNLKGKIRCDETLRERLHLTELGLKQIKGLVIRAPPARHHAHRSRSRKKEDKGLNTIMSEEVTCSTAELTEEHSMDKAEHPFENAGEHDVLSPDGSSIKQEEGMEISEDIIAPDTTAEQEDLLLDDTNNDDSAAPDPEDTTDPFEFFGVHLLEKHLHMELELLSTGKKKKSKKERKKEKKLRKEAKMAFFNGPSVPDPTALSLSVVIAEKPNINVPQTPPPPMAVASAIEPKVEVTESPVVTEAGFAPQPITTTVTTSSSMEVDVQPPSSQQQQPSQPHTIMGLLEAVSSIQSPPAQLQPHSPPPPPHQPPVSYTEPTPTPVSAPLSIETSVSINMKDPSKQQHHSLDIKMDTSPPMSSVEMTTPPIDLMPTQGQYHDLPHVDGNEMAHFLAGIESESSMQQPPPSSSVESSFPPYMQHHVSQMQSSFDPLHALSKQAMGGGPSSMKSPTLSPTSLNSDPFRAVFGDEKDDFRGLAPKIDPQKQLRKWQSDEKLGEGATISPVLYANMVHKEDMLTKYKDWPSRARAIARLWRKLPAEQREPFRLKARENRVKQKENKKKKNVGKATSSSRTLSNSSMSPLPTSVSGFSPTPQASAPAEFSQGNPQQHQQQPNSGHHPIPQHFHQQQAHHTMPIACETSVTSSTTEPKVSATSHTPTPPHTASYNKTEHRTPYGATVLTVPEPQQLSPLLQTISPPFTISSLSNKVRSSPTSPYFPASSPYPPNTPSTPHTPATPISDSASNKSDTMDSGVTKEKKKKPKLTKQEREQNKLMREQKKKIQDKKEQQWKLLQQQRIFEQQRQAILSQSKAMAMDVMHPSQRFNATINSSLAEDVMHHNVYQKTNKTNADNTQNTSTSSSNNRQDQSPASSATIKPSAMATTASLSTSTSKHISKPPDSSTATSSTSSSFPSSKTAMNMRGDMFPASLYHPKDAHHPTPHMQQQQQAMAGKNMMDPFNPGAQDHFPDSTNLGNVDPAQMRNADQQKAFLVQQQQYMASQQQYIQWQLAQQVASNMYNQGGQKTPKDSKDMPVDSEEQHQERLRALFNQRQSQFMKSQAEQASKRPGDVAGNQPFPFPENRPGAMNYGGYSSRMPPSFPAGNASEAAIYQQMLMEVLMRYHKGQEMDPNMQIPPSQFYMMVEIAKQYYARQMQYGKGFPPPPTAQPTHPSFPYPRPPYDERMYPPYGHPGPGGGGGGLTPNDGAVHNLRPPGLPTTSMSQRSEDTKSPAQSKVHTSIHGGLPKSASFEISRIAADSTSNDDYPPNNESYSNKKQSNNTTGENEISSSKGSRTFSDSTLPDNHIDQQHQHQQPPPPTAAAVPVSSDENLVSSGGISGHNQEKDNDRETGSIQKTRKNCSTVECRFDGFTVPKQRPRSRRLPARCDEFDEDVLLGRCEQSRYNEAAWSADEDEDSCDGSSGLDGDEDRCLLDNIPVCTMGVVDDDEEEQLGRGRLYSSESAGDGSVSIAETHAGVQDRRPSYDSLITNRPPSSSSYNPLTTSRPPSSSSSYDPLTTIKPQPASTKNTTAQAHPQNRFSNIPDSAYMKALLERSPMNPQFVTHPPMSSSQQQHTTGFPAPKAATIQASGSSGEPKENRLQSPFDTDAIGLMSSAHHAHHHKVDPKLSSPTSAFMMKRPPFTGSSRPLLSGDSVIHGLSGPPGSVINRFPSTNVGGVSDSTVSHQQNTISSSSSSNNTASWSIPNMMASSIQDSKHDTDKLLPDNPLFSNAAIAMADKSSRIDSNPTPVSNNRFSPSVSSNAAVSTPATSATTASATTSGSGSQQAAAGSAIAIQPGTPQYHQLFICQHQLLIMQFQQYQFQLQAQFQQLRIQQMSSQQLMMLSQQFHQQMMLLQQQFNQQQAQLHRMAATGMQFTESQLNAMYSQQMVTQQGYQQWIMTLSPTQRMHLQQRMQACMQDVQHQTAQIMQQVRTEEEPKAVATKKPTKPRRPKKKSALPDQADPPPPKMPVPELSESMQMLQQIGQQPRLPHPHPPHPHPPRQEEAFTSKPPSSTRSIPVTTASVIHTPVLATPASVTHPSVVKPPASTPSLDTPHPTNFLAPPPSSHTTTVASQPIPQPIKNSIPTQIEEIQKSFIRQQQNIRKEKKDSTPTPTLKTTTSPADSRKQMFFPDKVPIHPSQLLRQKWNTTPGHSPTVPVTPPVDASPGQGISTVPPTNQGAQVTSISVTHHGRPQQQPGQNVLSPSGKPKVAASQSPFSMSTILAANNNNANGTSSASSSSYQPPQQGSHSSEVPARHPDVAKMAGFISQAEHLKEMEKKKNAMKTTKKEEKEKQMVERKKARELEKQKRMDEKAKLKVIREQEKHEKMQQRQMVKQQALQAKKDIAQAKKDAQAKKKALLNAVQTQQQQQAATLPPKPPDVLLPAAFSPPPKIVPPTPPKIPLCEPDVQVVYSLAQPLGFSSVEEAFAFSGKFGDGMFENIDDVYTEKPVLPVEDATDSLLLKPSSELNDASGLINDIPLFDEQMVLDAVDATVTPDGDGGTTGGESDEPEITIPHEFRQVFACNHCYGPLRETVYYVDRGLDEVSEGVFDRNDIISSDQLAFCSNECVDTYQQKIDYEVDDDFALVDAVKAVSMVTLDESHVFQPLPTDEVRGDDVAPGMDPAKLDKPKVEVKKRWKRWNFPFTPEKKHNKIRLEREDLYELMNKYDIRLKIGDDGIKDKRTCMLCNSVGDGETAQASRLLNYDVDRWVHLNCALWSIEVYEALNGGLHNVDKAYARAIATNCAHCGKLGASINCSHTFGAQQRQHCEKVYHFCCAMQAQCTFYKDKTILCGQHKTFGVSSEELRNFTVRRKVYIERDITKQIAKMLHLNNELDRKEYTFRVGNLIFHELGHVPVNLLDKLSDKENIYPIGFETASIFWDYHNVRKRKYYTSSISERNGEPLFKLKAHSKDSDISTFINNTSKSVWEEVVLKGIRKQREKEGLLKFFPEFITGQSLFGLMDCTVRRMMESLPSIDTIENYNFRFGRTPLLIAELPLALNPTGCIRSEKFHKHHMKRVQAMRVASDRLGLTPTDSINSESWLSYPQRTAHILGTKTGQYRRMRQEWRTTVVLGRSRIQGLGLFLKKDVEENTFLIEYIGSLIRNEVANRLEDFYDRQNRGIYMFRIDNDLVVDATMTGGPARYINHSCDPNCVAEIVSIEGKKRIIIISSSRIEKGEELTYDYKFELEDDSKKIACLCGATNCRKWMN